MNKKLIIILLLIVLTIVFSLPVAAEQTDIDFDKIVKEAQKIMRKTSDNIANETNPSKVEISALDISNENVQPTDIGPLGFGWSTVDQSPFEWWGVIGSGHTYAYSPQPYVYVESWMYKNETLVSHKDHSRYYSQEAECWHPQLQKGTVGTKWRVSSFHYISTGGTLVGFEYSNDNWTVN